MPWVFYLALFGLIIASSKRSTAKAVTVRKIKPPQKPKKPVKPPRKTEPVPVQRKRLSPIKGATLPSKGRLSYLFQRTPSHKHRGIDFVAPIGTAVYAAESGIVEKASNVWQPGFSGYGRHIVIRHGDQGPWTLYSHLDTVIVSPGNMVQTGQKIGTVGNTKFSKKDHTDLLSKGSHLHFEVAPKPYPMASEANRIDPIVWLIG